MNTTLKRYALSSTTTFITAAVTTLATQLSVGNIEWTGTFWFAVFAVVIRAGFKAAVEGWAGQHADA